MSRDQGSGIRDQGFENRHCEERSDGTIRIPTAPLVEPAYGKLNLTLEVLGKRPDGFHDLRMVMCSVDLADTVTLRFGNAPGTCSVCTENGITGVPCDERNLAWQALRAYADAAALALDHVSVTIQKRIPMQAGMAGGSSDAAAVLRALNRHFGAFSDEKLRQIGLRLGSDVPYCLFGGVALAEGRGEILTRLPDLPKNAAFVLLRPDFSVSTPALFRALDERPRPSGRSEASAPSVPATAGEDGMLRAIRAGDAPAIGRALSNDFTPVLAQDWPVINRCKADLLAQGALGSELTGTGSVVFGLFDGPDKAAAAAEALAAAYPFACACSPVPAPDFM